MGAIKNMGASKRLSEDTLQVVNAMSKIVEQFIKNMESINKLIDDDIGNLNELKSKKKITNKMELFNQKIANELKPIWKENENIYKRNKQLAGKLDAHKNEIEELHDKVESAITRNNVISEEIDVLVKEVEACKLTTQTIFDYTEKEGIVGYFVYKQNFKTFTIKRNSQESIWEHVRNFHKEGTIKRLNCFF